jgi:Major Facilitator Superfamily
MVSLSMERPFFGWKVVAGAFVLAVFGWGVGFYGPPIYLHAVLARTGWPVALVSAAVTAHFLTGTLVIANLPRLYRHFGLPAVTGTGAVLLGLGVTGWAVAAAPWQLFVAAAFSGMGWVTMGAAAVNAIIAPWFVRARPAALAMAYNGASIGGVLFSPLWVALIAAIGFAWSALAVGAVMVVAMIALSTLVFGVSPAAIGQSPDGDAAGTAKAPLTRPDKPLAGASLWRDRRFLTLAAGMALGLFAQVGLIAHLYSLLVPAMGDKLAGLAMGLATACAIVGRTAVGWLMPAGADRRVVASAAYAVQIAGSLALIAAAGENLALLTIGVMLFGSGIGNATSLPPLIAQAEFAPADVQRVVPLIVATAQAAYAFAPAGFGLLRAFDSGASASPALFAAAALIQLAAIAALLAGRDDVGSDETKTRFRNPRERRGSGTPQT